MESFNIKYDDIINHSDIINSAVESRNEELLKAFSTYQKNPIKGYIGVGRAGDIKYFDEYTDRIIKKIFPKAELNSFDLYDVLEGAVEKGHTSFFAEFLNKINLLGDNNPFYIPGKVTLREFYRRILNKENIEKWLEVAKDKGHKEMYNYLDTVLRSKRM